MDNKTNIEEDIKILKEIYTNPYIDSNNPTIIKVRKQAIESILADRERLEKENNKFINAEVFSAKQLKFNEEQREKYFVHKSKVEQLQVKANKYDILVEKIKEKIEEIRKYEEIAGEQIEEKIVIADSDSLNSGRKQAHRKDIEVLQELIPEEEK